MLITTQSKNILRKYYNVFDTNTGIQYSLTLEIKPIANSNATSVDVRITRPGPILEPNEIFYIQQEAIDFWHQLIRMKPERWFVQFIDESLNDAIQTLGREKEQSDDS